MIEVVHIITGLSECARTLRQRADRGRKRGQRGWQNGAPQAKGDEGTLILRNEAHLHLNKVVVVKGVRSGGH